MHSFEQPQVMRASLGWAADGGVVVTLAGDLDGHSAARLGVLLDGVLQRRPLRITVDLAGVTFFSCGAATQLLRVRAGYSGELRVRSAPAPVTRIMRVLGVNEQLQALS